MADKDFKLSKRVRILSKFLGYESAFSLTGSKKLGQGAFGSVYSTKGAAVKVARSKGKEALENEIKMLQQTKGISVAPKLLGKGKGFAAIQKFEGNTLWDSLTRVKEDPVFADYIFRKLVESVGALHRKNIAHRDLHAGNIFITNDYQVKILDYGQALKKSAAAYYEAIFGGNYDPRQGALGLVGHSFQNTQSYKTYNRILHSTVNKICKLVGADPKIIFTDYADIEGDEKKETIYFDELQKITLLPDGTDKNIITLLYNALDTALKINTKNPNTKKGRIISKNSLLKDARKTTKLINRTPLIKGNVFKAETGGTVPGSGNKPVELHGTEVVVPANKNLPQPPEGVLDPEKPWHLPMPKSPGLWGTLKARLTGRPNEYGNYSSYVNISEADADKLIANMKKDPRGYPQLDQTTGTPSQWMDRQRIYQEWLVEAYLQRKPTKVEEETRIYTPGEKFVDDQIEISNDIIDKAEEALQETSDSIMDAIDEILRQDQERLNKFKEEEARRLAEKIEQIYSDDEDDEEPEGLDDLLDSITEEEDDAEPEGLDDLLDSIVSDEDEIPEGLDDLLESIIEDKEEKKSSYVSNKKLLDFLSTKLTGVEKQLNSINDSILNQTVLIGTSMNMQLSSFESVASQDAIIGDQFARLAEVIERQNKISNDAIEQQERSDREAQLEQSKDVASSVSFKDLTKETPSNRRSRIADFYLRRLGRRVLRKSPKIVRKARIGAKKVQRVPGRLQRTATNKIINKLPKSVQRYAGNVRNLRSISSGATGIKGAARNIPGVRQALAMLEYSDRKSAGQTDLQAVAGVGGGLAGAAAGAAIGTMLFPGVGTLAGLLIGAAFSAAGATVGSKVADVATGANRKYETGGAAKSGLAVLHGTEAVINQNQIQPVDPIGGILLSATSQYINKAGPAAQAIAPVFKQVAAPLKSIYDVPSTLVQTNIGGSFPSMQSTLKKVKDKKKVTPEEELSAIEKDLLNTQNPESFAEKLLNILDPQGKFQQLLKNINNAGNPDEYDGTGISGDLKGNIVHPMEGGTMEDYPGAKFGAPRDGGSRKHLGRDIVGPPGMKVVSALPGKVTSITNIGKLPSGGWSKGIYVRHDNGMETRYLHVNPSVKQGDTVKAGQKIATITEQDDISSVPHLHFELIVNGKHVDPEPIVKGSLKLKDIAAGKVPGLSIEKYDGTTPGQAPSPTGDYDVIIPLDHVKPGNETKIPDTKGGSTFKNASATGADGRERQHQDKAAAQVKAKLEEKGFRVKVIAPEDFGNYEDYDRYIQSQSSKGTRIIPLHFDAAVGQGGTGFLTRTRAGDSADAALAKPIQAQLSKFQRANPSLGNLGPTDTASNATINRASASPAALVEMGSMVAWEKTHGKNFTSSSKFNELTSGLANAIASSVPKPSQASSNITPPAGRPRIETMNLKGTDTSNQFVIINQQSKPNDVRNLGPNNDVSFVPMAPGRWRSKSEVDQSMINKIRLYYQ